MSSERVFYGMTEGEMLEQMREIGIAAELVRSSSGNTYIKAPFGAWFFVVYFFKGDGEPTYSVASICMFWQVDLPLSFLNRWNRVHLFPKAVMGDDGGAVIEMDIVLRGVTQSYLQRCFGIWASAVRIFAGEISQYLESSLSDTRLVSQGSRATSSQCYKEGCTNTPYDNCKNCGRNACSAHGRTRGDYFYCEDCVKKGF